jgi:polyhydroxyalkanoate synthesis regulator phasin
MALLDKVKSQAKDLKGKVEGKVEDVQAKRKVDDLLDDLGRILYAERTERPMADAEIEISRLVGELKTLEEEGAEVLPAS